MSKKVVTTQDIELARLDRRWEITGELVRQWVSKSSSALNPDEIELFRCLVLGERELEKKLQTFEGIECLSPKREILQKESLKDAHNYLSKAITFAKTLKQTKLAQFKESHLLYAKYCFMIGNDKDTVKYVDLTSVNEGQLEGFSKRARYVVAETLVCKGLALEKLLTVGDEEKIKDIIQCYEKSGEITLSLLNNQPKTGSYKKSIDILDNSFQLSSFLKTGLLRPIYLSVKLGKVEDAIIYSRKFLHVVESPATASVRRTMARMLAEMLLFSMCEVNYSPPLFCDPTTPGNLGYSVRNQGLQAKGVSLKRPKINLYPSESVFLPQDDFEESLLLLMISESLVIRDTSVVQFPDKRDDKFKTTEELAALHDMLSFVLSQRDQYELLSESLEKGLAFVFEDFHLWRQFALSLICCGKFSRALLVLDQCLSLQPNDTTLLLIAAKLCINHLHKYQCGLSYAQKALEASDTSTVAANSWLAIGICQGFLASKVKSVEEAQKLRKKSLESLQQAHESDPTDPEILLQLALNQAIASQINSAFNNVQSCLNLDPSNQTGLHLLVLLLSAQNKHLEALDILEVAISEYPEEPSLLLTKIKLVQDCFGPKQALTVGEAILHLWSSLYNDEPADVDPSPDCLPSQGPMSLMKRSVSDSKLFDTTRSLKQMTLAETNLNSRDDGDGGSSIAASVQLERTLSEAASGTIQRLSIPVAVALLSKIWLTMAELYITMEQEEEATNCIQESASVFPLSPDVLYMRGRLNELIKNPTEAKGCYESGLAVAPRHIGIMQHLAQLYVSENNLLMAEKLLRDALVFDPNNPSLWHDLGTALKLSNEHEEASHCLMTALNLETTSPVVPYTTLSRLFRPEV